MKLRKVVSEIKFKAHGEFHKNKIKAHGNLYKKLKTMAIEKNMYKLAKLR